MSSSEIPDGNVPSTGSEVIEDTSPGMQGGRRRLYSVRNAAPNMKFDVPKMSNFDRRRSRSIPSVGSPDSAKSVRFFDSPGGSAQRDSSENSSTRLEHSEIHSPSSGFSKLSSESILFFKKWKETYTAETDSTRHQILDATPSPARKSSLHFFRKAAVVEDEENEAQSPKASVEVKIGSSTHSAASKIKYAVAMKATTLDLTRCQLKAIPPDITRLSKLQVLFLGWNELMEVNPLLFDLLSLRELHLNCNQIERIPEGVCNLAKLEQFPLFYNKLVELPDNMCTSLLSLKKLRVFGNLLSSLPEDIGEMKDSLVAVEAQHNHILSVPNSICELVNVQHLDLSHNKLITLPSQLGAMRSLAQLDLSHNKLRALHDSVFSTGIQRSVLVSLQLSHNVIMRVPPSVWRLPKLRVLDLSSNRIATVPEEVSNANVLEELYLGNNDISLMPWTAVSKMRSLRLLSVYMNAITDFSASALMACPQLRVVDLCDNPLMDSTATALEAFRQSGRTVRTDCNVSTKAATPTPHREKEDIGERIRQSVSFTDNIIHEVPARYSVSDDSEQTPTASTSTSVESPAVAQRHRPGPSAWASPISRRQVK